MSNFDIIIAFSKLDAIERADLAENPDAAKQFWPEASKADLKKLADFLDLMKRTAV